MNNQRPEWITRAVEEYVGSQLGELSETFGAAVRATLAEIIAKHAPAQDQAIGPGDVVQFKVGYTPPAYIDSFVLDCMMFDRGEVIVVEAVESDGLIFEGLTESPIPFEHVTRIGRAKYWPDGSLVEGGGK